MKTEDKYAQTRETAVIAIWLFPVVLAFSLVMAYCGYPVVATVTYNLYVLLCLLMVVLLRCPKCGDKVFSLDNYRIAHTTLFPPATCVNCKCLEEAKEG
jgi:hypothetical protein